MLKPQPDGTPTGSVKRVCTSSRCPERHATNNALTLVLQLDAGFESATVTWTSSAVDLSGVGANTTQLIIPVAKLPVVGSVDASATFTVGNKTGMASIVVPVDGAPYCPEGTSCMGAALATGVNDTFPDAVFQATVSNVVDDAPLR